MSLSQTNRSRKMAAHLESGSEITFVVNGPFTKPRPDDASWPITTQYRTGATGGPTLWRQFSTDYYVKLLYCIDFSASFFDFVWDVVKRCSSGTCDGDPRHPERLKEDITFISFQDWKQTQKVQALDMGHPSFPAQPFKDWQARFILPQVTTLIPINVMMLLAGIGT